MTNLTMDKMAVMVYVLFGAFFVAMATRGMPETPLPDHYQGERHNVEFDHEAFLGGKENAQEFEQMTEEESKKRLSGMLRKVDTDNDAFIDKEELTEWIMHSLKEIDYHNAREHLKVQDADRDGKLTWEEYNEHVFGYMPADEHNENSEYGKDVKRMEKIFKVADEDSDGFLDAEEYLSFNNPRAVEKMEPIVVEQLLENMDWNRDGTVDLQEFLGDYYKVPGSEEGVDPEWIGEETELFKTQLDTDGSGRLEGRELFEWVRPAYRPTAEYEAGHLIKKADTDDDGKLTETEVLDKYHIFAGSRATHFGKHIRDSHHEEL